MSCYTEGGFDEQTIALEWLLALFFSKKVKKSVNAEGSTSKRKHFIRDQSTSHEIRHKKAREKKKPSFLIWYSQKKFPLGDRIVSESLGVSKY